MPNAECAAHLIQEQLRSCVSYGGAYGHEVASWFDVGALAFCAALTLEDDSRISPSAGRSRSHVLSPRLAHQFAALVVQPPCADESKAIFVRRMQAWLDTFPSSEVPNPLAVQQVYSRAPYTRASEICATQLCALIVRFEFNITFKYFRHC